MANIFDVCNFLIHIQNADKCNDAITNMRLNTLLYFLQGHHLVKTETPLFADDFEEWEFGPVVPCVYEKYKVLDRNPILQEDDAFSIDHLSEDEFSFLLETIPHYYDIATGCLVNKARQNKSPWTNCSTPKAVISKLSMQTYFSMPENLLQELPPMKIPESAVIGYSTDGTYILPVSEKLEDA